MSPDLIKIMPDIIIAFLWVFLYTLVIRIKTIAKVKSE